MLPRGIIKPSVSPWASPVLLVTKADNTLQLCIDYWNLNKVTIKDSYPLPHIQETLDTLYGNNLFTTLHLLKGYHQIEVEEGSREKTAFTTHIRLFQYICLPFVLPNASTSLGIHPPRLHWQVCNPIHWQHTYIQWLVWGLSQSCGISPTDPPRVIPQSTNRQMSVCSEFWWIFRPPHYPWGDWA